MVHVYPLRSGVGPPSHPLSGKARLPDCRARLPDWTDEWLGRRSTLGYHRPHGTTTCAEVGRSFRSNKTTETTHQLLDALYHPSSVVTAFVAIRFASFPPFNCPSACRPIPPCAAHPCVYRRSLNIRIYLKQLYNIYTGSSTFPPLPVCMRCCSPAYMI